MNLNESPTVEELADLYAKCDDSTAHHFLWVSESGNVSIVSIPFDSTPAEIDSKLNNVRFRWETYASGNDLVGKAAALDSKYMELEFKHLINDWNSNKKGFVDF